MDSKWSTIGDGGDQSAFGYSDVTVNRISVSNLEELWQQQFKVDFPECNKNEQVRFSRGDHKLIEMLRDSLKLACRWAIFYWLTFEEEKCLYARQQDNC